MDQSSQSYKEKLYGQIQDQYGKLVYSYTCNLKQAARLKKNAKRLKWLQIVLSAVSSGSFLATVIFDITKLAWIGGIMSALLLIINSIQKEKDYAAEQKSYTDVASKLWLIRESYVSLMTDFERLSESDIATRRDDLIARTAEVYAVAPQTDEKAYAETQEALKKNEEQFFTQEELNKLLPAQLRK